MKQLVFRFLSILMTFLVLYVLLNSVICNYFCPIFHHNDYCTKLTRNYKYVVKNSSIANARYYSLKEKIRFHRCLHLSLEEIMNCENSEADCPVIVELATCEDTLLNQFLKKGHLPHSIDEILISEKLASECGLKIDSQITVKSSAMNKNYTVCGIVEDSYGFPLYKKNTFVAYIDLGSLLAYGDCDSYSFSYTSDERELVFSNKEILVNNAYYRFVYYFLICLLMSIVLIFIFITFKAFHMESYLFHLYLGGCSKELFFKKSLCFTFFIAILLFLTSFIVYCVWKETRLLKIDMTISAVCVLITLIMNVLCTRLQYGIHPTKKC